MSTDKIRLGIVPYLNAFPYLYRLNSHLGPPYYDISVDVPTQLNAKLASQELDAALISSIEFARHPRRYVILSRLGIGTHGSAGSVLLFSRCPVDRLQGQTIGLTDASATGVVLLKILLERHWGVAEIHFRTFSDFPEAQDQFPALLVIGDEALKFRERELWHAIDLGKAWKDWSGLSFIFALWVARRQWLEENLEEACRFSDQLKASVSLTEEDKARMIQRASQGWNRIKDVERYLSQFDYQLEDSHWDGLVSFYQWAKRLGEIESVPDIQQIKEGIHGAIKTEHMGVR